MGRIKDKVGSSFFTVREIPICIEENEGQITGISFCGIPHKEGPDTAVLIEAKKQLHEYFYGLRRTFDMPVRYGCSGFVKKVLDVTSTIPYGRTITYKEVAIKLGDARLARAAGNALGKNPLPVLIPCHRVVSSDGRIGGYSGGVWIKRILLEIEGGATYEDDL